MGVGTRIGIFGFYSYRNLGDDLMAFLFSSYLQERGFQPVVFSKRGDLDLGAGIEVCTDLRAFADSVDVVVFGGGGLLIPRPKLSDIGRDFTEDLKALLAHTQGRSTPFYGFSLGGAGKDFHEIVPEERKELIRRLDYVTLRNREDLRLLEQADKRGEFLDDVVWTTARRIPQERRPRRQRLKVGFNLYLGNSGRMKIAKALFRLVAWLRKDIDLVFYEIHPNERGDFEAFSSNLGSAHCTRKTLVDIADACREVSSLDLLVTTRLHFGVMAMSYGVPSIAFAGAEKTRLLYNRIGRGDFYWPREDLHKILLLFLRPGALRKLARSSDEPVAGDVVDNAMLHYDRLIKCLGGGA